jgi:hypothetical protein
MSQCLPRITFIGPTSISILRLSQSFILSAFPWLARLGPNRSLNPDASPAALTRRPLGAG